MKKLNPLVIMKKLNPLVVIYLFLSLVFGFILGGAIN